MKVEKPDATLGDAHFLYKLNPAKFGKNFPKTQKEIKRLSAERTAEIAENIARKASKKAEKRQQAEESEFARLQAEYFKKIEEEKAANGDKAQVAEK